MLSSDYVQRHHEGILPPSKSIISRKTPSQHLSVGRRGTRTHCPYPFRDCQSCVAENTRSGGIHAGTNLLRLDLSVSRFRRSILSLASTMKALMLSTKRRSLLKSLILWPMWSIVCSPQTQLGLPIDQFIEFRALLLVCSTALSS